MKERKDKQTHRDFLVRMTVRIAGVTGACLNSSATEKTPASTMSGGGMEPFKTTHEFGSL